MGQVSIFALKPGMLVDEPVHTKDGQLLIQHGVVLTDHMMEQLRHYKIEQVAISEPKSHFISPAETLRKFLKNFFDNKISEIIPIQPEGNLNDKMPGIAVRAKAVLNDVLANEEILNLCVEMKLINNQKLFFPAIHSCVYSLLVAGAMDFPEEEMYQVAVAALLRNIGLCELSHLLNVEERSAVEDAFWKMHTEYGFHIINERGIGREAARLVLNHHERFDGKGYPGGCKGDEIPMGAKIIRLCSDFDRLIFSKKIQPKQIADIFFASSDGQYDSRVIDAFLMNIPLYPLGSIVRLSNQEVGVVINIRKNMPTQPIVRICYNSVNKSLRDTKVADLSKTPDLFIKEIIG